MSDTPTSGGTPEEPALPDEIRRLLKDLTGSDEIDPQLAKMLGESGIASMDPQVLRAAMGQVQSMFSGGAGGSDGEDRLLDVSVATDVARTAVASADGDRSVTDTDRHEVVEAARIAGLWLDEVTAFEAPSAQPTAWSRAEWVEATMPRWAQVCAPVATGVGSAVGSAMRKQMDQLGGQIPEGMLPPGMAEQLPPGMDLSAVMGQMEPMLARMSGAMFSLQLGQAVGALASETVSGTEVGLPITPAGVLALVPTGVAAFAEGLEVDPGEVRIYLAVREAARVRLFEDVAWLGPQLIQAVQDYARDIQIDTDAIESSIAGVDPSDAAALQKALQDNLFRPNPTPAQQRALERLESYLALVEGWVDVVTDRATRGKLPHADALGEAVRRRRATGGPAATTFASLVGLELKPRRLRDAANLFAAVEDKHGPSLRDAAWAHPDVAPTAADLDDPLGYVEKVGATPSGGDDLDAELARLLDGEPGSA